jgi:protein-tyrosine phosphatase
MSDKARAIKRECKLLVQNIWDSSSYYLTRGRKVAGPINKVVFVCKGNICRSAFADYLMRAEAKGKLASVESCGLNAVNRMSAPDEAIAMATKFGLDLEGHLSKGWEACEFEDADLILPMEFWQYRKLVEFFPHKKLNIRLLRDFSPFPENLLCNINDPFGQSEEIFEKCFRQIKRAIQALNARI